MKRPRIVFVAAYSSRSQAYAQAMKSMGITPDQTILFGAHRETSRKAERPLGYDGDLFFPDLSEPLEETLADAAWETLRIAPGDINDPQMAIAIRNANADLVVYSGYGGQIVGESALGAGAPFLHLHAGWLPLERGSTTVYYGILSERRCAVTAILMDRAIDTGPVLARKSYLPPVRGMDVDHLYDGAIRADLLMDVLRRYVAGGSLEIEFAQTADEGCTYYVIHPVLKHIALLSLHPTSDNP